MADPFDSAILQIWLQLAIRAHGQDNILVIENYHELFQQMADRSVVWATIHDEGEEPPRLWIHMEPLDDNLLSADDIIEMEKKVKDGKVN